jgi:hypothetical protein
VRLFRHLACLVFLAAFALLLFQEVFAFDTFGPEFPLFYFYTDGLTFAQMLRSYTYNELMWYRPTVHSALYWVGDQFLHWHDLSGWKVYHFCTVLATAFSIYWLVAGPLRFGALAGALSGGFFLAQPSIFAFVMEMSGFDFVYVLLAVLCAGFFIQAHRGAGRLSLVLAWFTFLISLSCKEVMLAMPFYLATVSAAFVVFEKARIRTEILRLVPFFALLPVYYVFHLARIPQEQFTGIYRVTADWGSILANLRNLTLWTARIYAFTGDGPDRPMYQSNWLNNSVGLAILLLTASVWLMNARRKPEWRLPGILLLAWVPAFLAIPVYAGGFIWHVNLSIAGYGALAGVAGAWWLSRIPSNGPRWLVIAVLAACALALGRQNLSVELHRGTHATGFLINSTLLKNPPLFADRIPPSALIYIEDRLRMGPWWYGCFGKLFNYVYLRHDLEEVIVPPLEEMPQDLKQRWAAHSNAFFFRYDSQYRWRDGTADLRQAISGRKQQADLGCKGMFEPGSGALRINAGGPMLRNRDGTIWLEDSVEAGNTYSSQHAVSGTTVPEIYQTERFHSEPFEYRLCVPNGKYRVKLRFAEIWFTAAGQRVFRVSLNGSTVLDNFDVFREAGGAHRAVDREFVAHAAGGELRLRFDPIISNPKISAVEIEPADR